MVEEAAAQPTQSTALYLLTAFCAASNCFAQKIQGKTDFSFLSDLVLQKALEVDDYCITS